MSDDIQKISGPAQDLDAIRCGELSIDIEGLGTAEGSIVLSLGAVAFDLASPSLERPFYVRISIIDSLACGLTHDLDTLEWWRGQTAARRALEKDSETPVLTVVEALEQLRDFVQSVCVERPRVWMKGPSYDGKLLLGAAKKVGVTLPWSYSRERCVRTICDDIEEPKRNAMGDLAHGALSDAVHQARWVREALLSKSVLEGSK